MIMIKSRRPSVHLQFHHLTVGSSVTFENGSTTLEMNVHSAPRAPRGICYVMGSCRTKKLGDSRSTVKRRMASKQLTVLSDIAAL